MIISVVDEPGEHLLVTCHPFEPDDETYSGEMYLGIFYNGTEEGFAVLSADQADRLALALVSGPQ